MRRRSLSALSLALLCLTGSAEAERIRLPEPPLPPCLVEEAPGFGGGDGFGQGGFGVTVGRFEFNRDFMANLEYTHRAGLHRKALREALECASEMAKSLREAVNTIRRVNAPEGAEK